MFIIWLIVWLFAGAPAPHPANAAFTTLIAALVLQVVLASNSK